MNKQKIKAELRRSACEEQFPFSDCPKWAIAEPYVYFLSEYEFMHHLETDDQRTLMLLFAEAL